MKVTRRQLRNIILESLDLINEITPELLDDPQTASKIAQDMGADSTVSLNKALSSMVDLAATGIDAAKAVGIASKGVSRAVFKKNLQTLSDAGVFAAEKSLDTLNSAAKLIYDLASFSDAGLVEYLFENLPELSESKTQTLYDGDRTSVKARCPKDGDPRIKIEISLPLVSDVKISYSFKDLLFNYFDSSEGLDAFETDLHASIFSNFENIESIVGKEKMKSIKKQVRFQIQENIGQKRSDIIGATTGSKSEISSWVRKNPWIFLALDGYELSPGIVQVAIEKVVFGYFVNKLVKDLALGDAIAEAIRPLEKQIDASIEEAGPPSAGEVVGAGLKFAGDFAHDVVFGKEK